MFELMKGDCLELMKAIPDASIDLILCDLPYGTTQNKWDAVIPFDQLWAEYRRICKGTIVLTAAQPFTSALVMSNPDQFKYQWVWEKGKATGFLNAKKQPLRCIEDVCVFYAEQPTYNPQGLIRGTFKNGRKSKRDSETRGECYGSQRDSEDAEFTNYPRQLISFSGEHKPLHPTQKPVALMEYMIRTYTNEGMTVLDNCMGSGTTGVACANTGRKFIGIEMDEKYFEIAKNRVESAYSKNELEDKNV